MIPVSYGHLPARQHWNEGYLAALKESRTMGNDGREKLIAELEVETATTVCEPEPAQLDCPIVGRASKADIAAAREELRKQYDCHLI